ncbi:MAG: helix-turn-helix domain-containing protein [Oscillospiraceae bacterium]|nr:helix-turn-helix domain-containing protein [Oscillospiraceae bacterium]
MEQSPDYYRRANTIMSAGIQSSSMEHIRAIASQVLDAELVVADRMLHPVACPEHTADAAWEDLMGQGLVPSLSWITELPQYPPVMQRGNSRMYRWTAAGSGTAHLLVDIERGGKKLAFLSAVARKSPEGEDFQELVMVLAGVLALQFENHVGHTVENSVFEHYMAALIEDRFNSDDADDLLRDTGLKPMGFYTLLAVDISHYSVTRRSPYAFRIAVEQAVHVTRSTIYNDRIVLLLSARSDEAAQGRDYSQLEQRLEEHGTYAAISRTIHNLWEMSKTYSALNKILSRRFCAPPGTRVLSAENMGITFVVDALLQIEKPEDLVDPRIRSLVAYDQRNNTEYVETLFTYLRYSRKISLTCDKLHIHRNTLDYRLRKITEMFNLDWTDGDLCFRLYLSLSALNFTRQRNAHPELLP